MTNHRCLLNICFTLLLASSVDSFTCYHPNGDGSRQASRYYTPSNRQLDPFLQVSPSNQKRQPCVSLHATPKYGNEENSTSVNWPAVGLLASVSFLYWYYMVLASAAVANEWPLGVPDFIPLVPGWPPSDQDLQPVLEDSFHFFYLSELLQNADAPSVNPIRLAAFNVDEAWIFVYLIALWKDPKRLPRPVLLGLWLLLGINLTNAFLAPYLLATEFRTESTETGKNPILSVVFGCIATAVIGYAASQCVVADSQAWTEFGELATSDRTYLAFCVDLPLFALFQPMVLSRVKALDAIDYVPIVGLLNWVFFSNDEEEEGLVFEQRTEE